MNFRIYVRGIVLILSLVAVGFAVKVSPLGEGLDKAWIDEAIRGHGLNGELLMFAATVLFTGVGLPRQLISFLGGYAFGFVGGTLLVLGATTLSCALMFFYARILGRDFVVQKFPRKIKRIDDFLHDNPFSMTLLVRLLPVGSNVATNLAAGVSSVKPLPFLLGSLIGYVPQTAIFALGGSGVALDPGLRISLSVILFVISCVIGAQLYRRYRHGKTLGRDIEREIGDAEGQALAQNTTHEDR